MIIAGYDAILDQSDQQNLYNHLSNYTNSKYKEVKNLFYFMDNNRQTVEAATVAFYPVHRDANSCSSFHEWSNEEVSKFTERK